MRFLHSSIGLRATLALSAGMMLLGAGTTFAAQSTSYVLQGDSAAATNQLGISASYVVNESEITWVRLPLSSTNFQIVPPMNMNAVSSSSSSSSSSSEAESTDGGTTTKTGSRRPRVELAAAGNANNVQTTDTSHTAAPTPTAAKEDSGETQTIQPELPTSSASSSSSHDQRKSKAFAGEQLITTHFFDAIDALGSSQSLDTGFLILSFTLLILCLLIACLLVQSMQRKKEVHRAKKTLKKKRNWQTTLAILLTAFGLTGILFAFSVTIAHAAQTVPTKHVYNGRLLDSAGSAITTAHTIRFSYWKSTDAATGDTSAGVINTGAANYGGWQEVHTVTPNSLGYFSVELGSVTALPTYQNLPASTLLSLFLQVDVKVSTASDTTYEMLDIDTTDTAIDRSGILSVPFSSNADTIDQREIGTSSGSIAVLGPNGQFGKSVVPGGTNSGSFVLDADNTESSEITLQFGATLGKKLTYDIVNNLFKFNASLRVQGDLTVTGLINGINVTQLQSSTGALKAWSGGGLNLSVAYGNYRLNGTVTNYAGGTIALTPSATSYVFFGSGGLTARTMAFPTDESFIPIAEVTTSAGSILSVLDRRALSTDDRERTVVSTFNPSFEKASYQGDGADNVGQLSVLYDTGSLKNFYNWTSTRSSLQDYDILLKVPVTDDFVRWQTSGGTNPMALTYRTTSSSSSNNRLDIQVYDTNGTAVTLSGSVTGLSNTSWTTTQIEFSGSPTWTAGQDMLIRLKVSAKDSNVMKISGLKLSTVELLKE